MIAPAHSDVRIERVDRPFRTLLALSIRMDSRRACLLIAVEPRQTHTGIVDARPRGDAIDAQGMQLRDALEGAHLDGIVQTPEAVRIALRTLDGPRLLLVSHAQGAARFTLEEGTIEGAALDLDALLARGPTTLERASVHAARALLAPYARSTKQALARTARTLLAIAKDAARIDDVPRLRADAQLLLAQHARLPRGATSARVVDYTTTPVSEREIALDPSKTAKATAEAIFAHARRLERGVAQGAARAQLVAAGRQKLEALAIAIAACTDVAEAATLVARAQTLGVRPQTVVPRSQRDTPRERTPHRRFVSLDGTELWVGRSAADNDALTVRLAKPHHIFLHVRDVPGSHVIIALRKDQTLSSDMLVDAATLAAHFSTKRGDAIVDVQYVPRRYVRKPRGAAIGAVMLTREKVLALTVERGRLSRLLATEIGTLGA